MLIKLLVIKIVASNFYVFSISFTTRLSPFDSSFNAFLSFCDSEKKATSVPDISAEQIMSDNSKIISAISTVSKCDIDRSNGSGSKF